MCVCVCLIAGVASLVKAVLCIHFGYGWQSWCIAATYPSLLPAYVFYIFQVAGVASLVKAVLCVHHGEAPPIAHTKTPNALFDWDSSPLRLNTQVYTII